MKLGELLDGVSAKHRSVLASSVGLPKKATASELARRLLDPARLEEIVAGLSPEARKCATRKVIGQEEPAYGYYFSGGDKRSDVELERCGLAFAFRDSWNTDYRVADDLGGPLAAALAAAHADKLRPGHAARWLAAPLQLAHDVAAVWAALHREPVRVKTDGEIYQRSLPKLIDALAPLELDDPSGATDARRLEAALGFLREEGCVRLALDSAGGWETKRELVPTGDLLGLLGDDSGRLQAKLLGHAGCGPLELAGLTLLARISKAPASLASFGAAARSFADEAAVHPAPRSGTDLQFGAGAILIAWLIGLAEIGVDGDSRPSAVRLGCPPAELQAGPLAVCQGNFEVVLLRAPTPAQRLELELVCEPIRGQPHVYTITRRSAVVGQRAGAHTGGALGLLRELAGELPQNVERTVSDWVTDYGPPLRVRTAMMLDAGDADTAQWLAAGPLAGLVVERIGDSLLAFAASRRGEVQRALLDAGRELDPDCEQISGTWETERPTSSRAEAAWQSQRSGAPQISGRLISTVGSRSGSGPAAAPRAPLHAPEAPSPPARLALAFELGTDGYGEPGSPSELFDGADELPDGGDVLDVILDAMHQEADVRITYTGAEGISDRMITPLDVEGAQVRAWCHLRGEELRFWIPAIQVAVPVS